MPSSRRNRNIRGTGTAALDDPKIRFSFHQVLGLCTELIGTGLSQDGVPFQEIYICGPRGVRKTWGALAGMIRHANTHYQAGLPLPVHWMGFTDTFRSHKEKTMRSLQDPRWGGQWAFYDDGHLAVYPTIGEEMVHLHLFGIEDRGAMDRVRVESHCLWVEEPAPSAESGLSWGVSLDVYLLALTSLRLPTFRIGTNTESKEPIFANMAVLTSNPPEEDHWTWKRFGSAVKPISFKPPEVKGGCYKATFRIPKEAMPKAQQDSMAVNLASRPDLLARLLEGEPGSISLGPEVAVGYDERVHVASEPFEVDPNADLWLGHDGGHTPTTVIGQKVGREARILAGLVTDAAGMKEHLENTVVPWLVQHAPWVKSEKGGSDILFHRYDPSLEAGDQGSIDESAFLWLKKILGGHFGRGAITWPGRREPILALFNSLSPKLQINPTRDTELLRKALRNRWHYPQDASGKVSRDLPKKPNHPWEDLGDSFCYLIGGMAPGKIRVVEQPHKKYAVTDFNPLDYKREPKRLRAIGSLS